MLSLYIHIPFCHTKCKYCSFQVCPTSQMQSDALAVEIKNYTDWIISEIKNYSNILKDSEKQIKSIYFGGGTPQLIWLLNIERIIDAIIHNFDTENIWEFSIEMNPYPQKQVFAIIKKLNKKYKNFSRIRFSFGIQSFDNKILSESGRDTSFPWLVEFFRNLQPLKKSNNIFNLDFIAFGKFNESKKWNLQLRNPNSLDFFVKLAESKFADSYSLYTLELFPGSLRYYQKEKTESRWDFWSDDDIYEEFSIIKEILLDRWYRRYELSNFSLLWKSSIHNRVYREMQNYIWLWTSASSFIQNPNDKLKKYLSLPNSSNAVRRTNTVKIADYNKWKYLDTETINNLTDQDLLVEEFFLLLRTDIWIKDISKYNTVLVLDFKQKIKSYTEQWFIEILDSWDNSKKQWIKLTDQWMDIYNDIVTELLEEI
jgi:oxygen-independent coproporphyrinogen-3 oxidase